MTPDVRRRLAVIQREWQRIDPKYLDEDEQRFWATIAGRQIRFEERADFAKKLTDGRATKAALEQFLSTCAAENPNRRLRMMALADRVSMPVERADFDDLVTLVTQAPTVGEGPRCRESASCCGRSAKARPTRPSRSSRAGRGGSRGRRARCRTAGRARSIPEAKRLLGALANSRGHRHEENAEASSRSRASCRCRSAPRCSPPRRATRRAPTSCSTRRARSSARSHEIANALAENLPAPKAARRGSRRRRREASAKARRPRAEAQTTDADARRAQRRPSVVPLATSSTPDETRRRCPQSAARPLAQTLPSRLGRRDSARRPRRLALAQEARRARPRARRPTAMSSAPRQLERVGPPLELLDVRGRLRVGRHGLAHLLDVRARPPRSSSVDVDRRPSSSPSRSQSAFAARGLGVSCT